VNEHVSADVSDIQEISEVPFSILLHATDSGISLVIALHILKIYIGLCDYLSCHWQSNLKDCFEDDSIFHRTFYK
jgi:hypothetical protein